MTERQGMYLFLFTIVVSAVLVMVGLYTLMIVVDQPSQEVKLDATAKLSEFNLDNNTNTVRYKLSVNVSFRNPSKKAAIDYDHIEVTAYYHAHRPDDAVLLPPFRQPRNNTTVLAAAFHGQSQLGRGGEFEQDKASGVYEIRVGLFLMVKSRLGKSELLHSDWCQTQHNLSAADSNTLRYNLTVNVTARNPNQKMGIYYDLAEARAYYHSQRLDAVGVNLTASYQRPDTTTVLAAGFNGRRQFLLLGHDFERDKAFGVYFVQVRLYLSVRFRLGKRESGVFDFPFDLRVADQRRSPAASYGYIYVDDILALDDHY